LSARRNHARIIEEFSPAQRKPPPQRKPGPQIKPVPLKPPPRLKSPLRRIAAASTASVAGLAQLDGRHLERRLSEAFRRQGFRVTGFGSASSVGSREAGADLGLLKDGERFLVNCRCWRKLEVGVTLIREFCGLLAVQGARGGFMLTCGRFTPEAIEFARLSRIRLYAGPQLAQLLELR